MFEVLAKCCHLNLLFTNKSTRGRGNPVPTPFNVIVKFDSFKASVKLLRAFTQRHIRCHEIRNWYTQLAWCLKGLCDDIREINLPRRRRYLRLACTVIDVRTCLKCLVQMFRIVSNTVRTHVVETMFSRFSLQFQVVSNTVWMHALETLFFFFSAVLNTFKMHALVSIVFKVLALTSFYSYYSMSRDGNTYGCLFYLKNVIQF